MLIPIATAASNHEYWLVSRAAGTAAMIFSSLAICVAFYYERVADNRERAIQLGALHELLGLATIVALAVHGFVLLGDNYLKPNFADIVVPFAEPYKRGHIAAGIVGGYLMTVLALLYYVRNRIGPARFKIIHRFTVLGWALSVAHTFNTGPDNKATWYLIVLLPVLVAVPVMFILRLVRAVRGRRAGLEPSPAPR
jgi:methionine sulfoxide reductase heme-binding subunit